MSEIAHNHIDEMDSLIKGAAESALNTAVIVSAKMAQGQVNYVYKIEAGDHKFIVKAFKRGWPEEGKLFWIEQRLTQYEVPHARMLYYSRGDSFFPHGFTISEYVEGQNALDAIASGSLSLETYYSRIGALLRRVHQVPARQYGYIGYGSGGVYPTFTEHKLIHEVQERLEKIADAELSDESVYSRIEEKVRRQLAPFEDRFKSVLIHADPVPKNAVWTTDHQLILIDWDDAIAGAWIADFAQLTYWHRYSNPFSAAVNHEGGLMRDAFFSGYGAVEFNAEEIAAMENALHIIHSVDLLPFYRRENNPQAFEQTKERLLRLLEQD